VSIEGNSQGTNETQDDVEMAQKFTDDVIKAHKKIQREK